MLDICDDEEEEEDVDEDADSADDTAAGAEDDDEDGEPLRRLLGPWLLILISNLIYLGTFLDVRPQSSHRSQILQFSPGNKAISHILIHAPRYTRPEPVGRPSPPFWWIDRRLSLQRHQHHAVTAAATARYLHLRRRDRNAAILTAAVGV